MSGRAQAPRLPAPGCLLPIQAQLCYWAMSLKGLCASSATAGIDDLREKREEITKQLREDEAEKAKIQQDVSLVFATAMAGCGQHTQGTVPHPKQRVK